MESAAEEVKSSALATVDATKNAIVALPQRLAGAALTLVEEARQDVLQVHCCYVRV